MNLKIVVYPCGFVNILGTLSNIIIHYKTYTMANIKYIIRNKIECLNKQGSSIIFLRYTHKGKVTYLSSGRTIRPEFWDDKNQKVKKSYSGVIQFNIYLDTFRQKLEDHVHKALSQDKDPTVNYIKEMVKNKNEKKVEASRNLNFIDFFQQFIIGSKMSKAPSTIIGYRNSIKHLIEFEKFRNEKLTWDSFNMDWYDEFKNYMFDIKDVRNNCFGKQIKTLKTVLNLAIERGYLVNLAFKTKNFKTLNVEVDNIYLNEIEIAKLMDYDFSGNLKLERVRDLFIVGCYTGLRFSDFTSLMPENIKDDFIQIRTKKTNQTVVIPYHHCVKIILSKYKDISLNSLPKALSNQKMNEYLKLIGELAGINENIIVIKMKGVIRTEVICKKYELLTTHTARRSFATNLYKQGYPTMNIMKITGHTTEKSFSKYIKVNQEEAALMLDAHWKNYYQTIIPPIIHNTSILKIA